MQNDSSTCAIILAAGEGKRMKSNHPKVLSKVLFKPMLRWVTDAVKDGGIREVCVVTGYKHQEVEEYLQIVGRETPELHLQTALQTERKGTAHAVMMTEAFLRAHSGGHVLILNGDAPFLSSEIIQASFALHREQNNAVTVIAATVDNPSGYGRIVRENTTGQLCAIVEEKDADSKTKAIHEVNSGAYWFSVDKLLSVLHKISNDNAQGEYYLPDALKLLLKEGYPANAFVSDDSNAILGANDCLQLGELNTIARTKILDELMANGTEIPCRDGVIIGPDVSIGTHVTILPSTILRGTTKVGNGCTVGPNTLLTNAVLSDQITASFFSGEHCTVTTSPPPFTTVNPQNSAKS